MRALLLYWALQAFIVLVVVGQSVPARRGLARRIAKSPFKAVSKSCSFMKRKIKSHSRRDGNNLTSYDSNYINQQQLQLQQQPPPRAQQPQPPPPTTTPRLYPAGSNPYNWPQQAYNVQGASAATTTTTRPGGPASQESGHHVDIPVDDFDARCFSDRGETFKKSPILLFYSSDTHSPETLGCKVITKIKLTTSNDDAPSEDSDLILDPSVMNEIRTSYDGRRPTYFLTHGFMASWNGDNWMCKIKDLVLNNSQANVFIVDWSGGAKPMLPGDYAAAVSNTKYVSRLVAAFINNLLIMSRQRDASKFHLIGHSLGAHISGFVGYSVNNLGRITGLDPAGPCFTTRSRKQEDIASKSGFIGKDKRRLSPASANLVVALHTDISLFGLNENCAHYDVYINGGYRQPRCPTVSLKSRFADFLNLDIKESLDPNIACAHSYSHKLLDTFASMFNHDRENDNLANRRRAQQISSQHTEVLLESDNNKCYPIAFACDDWNTFKAGECGFCFDRDSRCVYTGLSYENFQLNENNDPLAIDSNTIERLRSNTDLTEDDDKFNDEDEQPGDESYSEDDDKLLKPPSGVYNQSRHFMRAFGKDPTCLYHYQVIVAARRSYEAKVDNPEKYYYYLQIPLEESGKFDSADGTRLHDRLVQVSHKVEPNSRAHQELISKFAPAINERHSQMSLQTQDIIFYTTLITFSQAPRSQCTGGDQDGDPDSGKWQLCRPLDAMREARLWSSSREKVDAIEWVSMNYMSGLTYEQRISSSYVFAPDTRIMDRNSIDGSEQAYMSDLTPTTRGLVGNFFHKSGKKIGCLLSKVDSAFIPAEGDFKCGRSSKQLKFAVNLTPINL